MGTDDFLAAVSAFAGTFAPQGYAVCNGSVMAANQNNALYSLLMGTYGGDGLRTFGLPDLRGGTAVGSGPQLQNGQDYTLGKTVPAAQAGFLDGEPAQAGSGVPPTPIRTVAVNAVPLNWVICLEGYYPMRP